MKILIKNLRRILLVQLFIVGATLSFTATNVGAVALPCAIPDTASEEVVIGKWIEWEDAKSETASPSGNAYLTLGDVERSDFLNECKNFTKFRKVFRNEIKTTHEYCTGIGEECEYSGSPGCGDVMNSENNNAACGCEIEFTYCTQTSTSRELEEKFKGGSKTFVK